MSSALGDSIRNTVVNGGSNANRAAHDAISNKVRSDVANRVNGVHGGDRFTRTAPEPRVSGNGNVSHLTRGLEDNYGRGPTRKFQAAPGNDARPPAPNGGSNDVGVRALDFNADGNAINPNTGDKNWNLWCLGWVNEATKWANGGKGIPELQAEDARAAYDKAVASGKIHYGDPPRGAIVFFPDIVNPANGDNWGHVGISLGGGRYRGTVPPDDQGRTVGDRDIPGVDGIPWMYA